jgi:hypothetical protein
MNRLFFSVFRLVQTLVVTIIFILVILFACIEASNVVEWARYEINQLSSAQETSGK